MPRLSRIRPTTQDRSTSPAAKLGCAWLERHLLRQRIRTKIGSWKAANLLRQDYCTTCLCGHSEPAGRAGLAEFWRRAHFTLVVRGFSQRGNDRVWIE